MAPSLPLRSGLWHSALSKNRRHAPSVGGPKITNLYEKAYRAFDVQLRFTGLSDETYAADARRVVRAIEARYEVDHTQRCSEIEWLYS